MFRKLFKRPFKKRERKPLKEEKKEEKKTELQVICAGDTEVYEALRYTMLLKPWKIENSMEEAAQEGNLWLAGGLALYLGNVEKVKEYFRKDGRGWKILEPGMAEKAVKKAQEYYAKYPE